MAGVTILQLPQANGLTGTEQIEGVQAGTSVRIPLSGIAALGVGPQGPIGPQGPAGVPFPTTTPAEIAAGVTPVDTNYPENDIRRYALTFGADDSATWANVTAVATQNGRVAYLAGLNLRFPSGNIAYNYHAHGIDGDNCTLNFTTTNGLLISTTDQGYQQSYQTGGFRNFQIVGSGKSGGGFGIKFGSSGNPIFGAMAAIDNFSIVNCQTGLTWGSNSWLQSIGNGCIQLCGIGILFPSGLTNAGEAIGFGHVIVSNNDNGISCTGGTLNFAHLALDYQVGYAVSCSGNGVVRATLFHLEANGDTDYWLKVTGSGSKISLDNGQIFQANANKTAFPVGQANNTGACAINLGRVWISNVKEANYGFNYLIDGHGQIGCLETVDQNSSSGTTACVSHNQNSVLIDGGFEKGTIVDWLSTGVGAQADISTAQHYAGTQSMTQAPTAGNRCIETLYAAVQPGVWVSFAARMLFAGTASTDNAFIIITFFDENGSSISTNAVTRAISTLPSSWTRYVLNPFGPAPFGSRYVRIDISKQSSSQAGSDGNGAIFWDDMYLVISGGLGRLLSVAEVPPQSIGAKTAAFTTRIPKGCAIDGIRIVNSTANAVTGGIKIGSSLGATDVLSTIAVGPSAEVYVPGSTLARQYLTSTGGAIVFFDAVTAWNSASLTFDVTLKRVMTQGY